MKTGVYSSVSGRIWYALLVVFCTAVLIFLVAPALVIVPLSFNSESFFSFPMPGLSLRWYEEFFTSERWLTALRNSVFVATISTASATVLGTVAAFGLTRPQFPFRGLVTAILLLPMIVPLIISAVGLYFFYAWSGLLNSFTGLILAHIALATPFVVITVTAALSGFDDSLWRAASSLGAPPLTTFRKVVLPLIFPGVASGALFAFIVSFDEVIVVLFIVGAEQRTLPRQMFSGIREQISPTITAAATFLIVLSIAVFTAIELLRRRSERLNRQP
jgi:putative spermidine/putrescine transport system permease protein